MKTYRNLTIVWAAIIAALSFTPGDYLPKVEWEILSFDTAAHFAVYALLAFFLQRWIKVPRHSLIMPIMYGVIIELVQGNFIPGRFFEFTDIVANTVGVFVGFGISVLIKK